MTFLRSKKVKTRRPYDCWGCCEPIPVGATAEVVTSEDMGSVSTVHFCTVCCHLLRTHDERYEYDGIGQGTLKSCQPDLFELAREEVRP